MKRERGNEYNSKELVKIWLDSLLESTGKSSLEDLTAEEIQAEIDDIKGNIDNEKLWALSDNIHYGYIEELEAYLEKLDELLKAKN